MFFTLSAQILSHFVYKFSIIFRDLLSLRLFEVTITLLKWVTVCITRNIRLEVVKLQMSLVDTLVAKLLLARTTSVFSWKRVFR